MTTQAEPSASAFDTAKLVLAVVVMVAGIAAFYYFSAQFVALPCPGVIGRQRSGWSLWHFNTALGGGLWSFIKEARRRFARSSGRLARKPCKRRLVVFAMVFLVGLILWLLDMFLFWGISSLTGQKGVEMALRWYVIHAYSNFENQVKQALEERIKRDGLEQYFGKILVPTEEVVEMRRGSSARAKESSFPAMSSCKWS